MDEALALMHAVLDLENGWWRSWWADPFIATLSFAFAINFFWWQERKQGLSRSGFFEGDVLFRAMFGFYTNFLLTVLK